ncbi:hypothetical protein ACSSS7_005321 [Eimeria intestinalis]
MPVLAASDGKPRPLSTRPRTAAVAADAAVAAATTVGCACNHPVYYPSAETGSRVPAAAAAVAARAPQQAAPPSGFPIIVQRSACSTPPQENPLASSSPQGHLVDCLQHTGVSPLPPACKERRQQQQQQQKQHTKMGQAESREAAPPVATAPHKTGSRKYDKRGSTASTATSASAADVGDERSSLRYGRETAAAPESAAAAGARPYRAGSSGSQISTDAGALEGATLEEQQQHRRQRQLEQKQRQQQRQQQEEGQQQTAGEGENNMFDSYMSLGFTGIKRLFSGGAFDYDAPHAAHSGKAEPAAAGGGGGAAAADTAATPAGGMVDVPEQEPEQPFIVPTRKLSHGRNPALAAMRREPKRGAAAAPGATSSEAAPAPTTPPEESEPSPSTPHPRAALAAGRAQGAAAKKAAEDMAASMRRGMQGQQHSEEDLHAHREAAFAAAARQEQSELLREERRKSSEARLAKEAAAMFEALRREEEERQREAPKTHHPGEDDRLGAPTAIGEARDLGGLAEACKSEQDMEREEGPKINLSDIPRGDDHEALPREPEAYKAHHPPKAAASVQGDVGHEAAASRSVKAEGKRARGEGHHDRTETRDVGGETEGERLDIEAPFAGDGGTSGKRGKNEHEGRGMREAISTSLGDGRTVEGEGRVHQTHKMPHEKHEAAPLSRELTEEGLEKLLHERKGEREGEGIAAEGERTRSGHQQQEATTHDRFFPPQPQPETLLPNFNERGEEGVRHQGHLQGKGDDARGTASKQQHHREEETTDVTGGEGIKVREKEIPRDFVPPAQPHQAPSSAPSEKSKEGGGQQSRQRGKREEAGGGAWGESHHGDKEEIEAGDDDPSLRARHTLSRELSESGLEKLLDKVRHQGSGRQGGGGGEQQWGTHEKQQEPQLHAGSGGAQGEVYSLAKASLHNTGGGDDREGTIPIASWPDVEGMHRGQGEDVDSRKAEGEFAQDARRGAPWAGVPSEEPASEARAPKGAPKGVRGTGQQVARPLSRELTEQELHELLRERREQEGHTERRSAHANEWENEDKLSYREDQESGAAQDHRQAHAVNRERDTGHEGTHYQQRATEDKEEREKRGHEWREEHFGGAHHQQQAVPLSREMDNEELRDRMMEAKQDEEEAVRQRAAARGEEWREKHFGGEGHREQQAVPLSREMDNEELRERRKAAKQDEEEALKQRGAARGEEWREKHLGGPHHEQQAVPLSREMDNEELRERRQAAKQDEEEAVRQRAAVSSLRAPRDQQAVPLSREMDNEELRERRQAAKQDEEEALKQRGAARGEEWREKHFGGPHHEQQAVPLSREMDNEELRERRKAAKQDEEEAVRQRAAVSALRAPRDQQAVPLSREMDNEELRERRNAAKQDEEEALKQRGAARGEEWREKHFGGEAQKEQQAVPLSREMDKEELRERRKAAKQDEEEALRERGAARGEEWREKHSGAHREQQAVPLSREIGNDELRDRMMGAKQDEEEAVRQRAGARGEEGREKHFGEAHHDQQAVPLSREIGNEELRDRMKGAKQDEEQAVRRRGEIRGEEGSEKDIGGKAHHEQQAAVPLSRGIGNEELKERMREARQDEDEADRQREERASEEWRDKHGGKANREQQAAPLCREHHGHEEREAAKTEKTEHAGVVGDVHEKVDERHGHHVSEGSRKLHDAEPLSQTINKEELHDLVEQIKADIGGDKQTEGEMAEGVGAHEAGGRPHAEEEVLRDLQHAQKAAPLSREQSKKGGGAGKALQRRPSAGATIVMEVTPGPGGTKTATAFGTTVHHVTKKDSLPATVVDPEKILAQVTAQPPSSSTTASSAKPHHTALGERTASSGSHAPLSRGMSHATNAPTNPPSLPSKLGSKK